MRKAQIGHTHNLLAPAPVVFQLHARELAGCIDLPRSVLNLCFSCDAGRIPGKHSKRFELNRATGRATELSAAYLPS
jgi:hypothetical protein